jgi:molecular chaperone HtpG
MSEQHQFKAEIQQLLDILIHSLYTNRDIFLRELISNASDALNRLQFEQLTQHDITDPTSDLYIEVKPDSEAGTLTISDTGIGMTHDELIENLGVIAHSGAKAFIQAMREQKEAKATDVIGQFGVGFYAAFMVADKIRVVSKSYRPGEAVYAWESGGGDTYTVEPAERETRGTDIILYLKDDAKEYLDEWKLREIIRTHSDFIAFPIHIGDEEEATNKQTAIWRRKKSPTSSTTISTRCSLTTSPRLSTASTCAPTCRCNSMRCSTFPAVPSRWRLSAANPVSSCMRVRC